MYHIILVSVSMYYNLDNKNINISASEHSSTPAPWSTDWLRSYLSVHVENEKIFVCRGEWYSSVVVLVYGPRVESESLDNGIVISEMNKQMWMTKSRPNIQTEEIVPKVDQLE